VRFYAITLGQGASVAALSVISGLASNQNTAGIGAPTVPLTTPAISGASIAGAWLCSVVNGHNDPGALDIEFDVEISAGGASTGSLKIYGIPQNIISQAVNFTNLGVRLYGGFTNGLPLANDQVIHQGLIANGLIYPAFGNWIGNELSLEFIIKPGDVSGSGGPTDVKNIIHNMPQGTPLSSAIQTALSTAFPNSSFIVNISNALTLNYPDQGFYQSIEQYQNYFKSLSHSILGTPTTTGYQGAQIFPTGYGQYVVTDFTNPGNTIPIQFEDLVGQPTWIDVNTIQVKTVLRGDINSAWASGNNVSITLPNPLLVTTLGQGALTYSVAGLNNNNSNTFEHGNVLLFNGSWLVNKVRHVGKFRQPTGESWVTIINAVAPLAAGAAGISQTGGIQSFTPSGTAQL
jgi:hypothetical protein